MIDELDDQVFAQVIRHTPLIAIDLIIKDSDGRVLVGLRNNEPAQGYYFVPGGRIRKGEELARAFKRVLESETGYNSRFEDAQLLGVYEHLYQNNRFGHADCGTHYVVLAYQIYASLKMPIIADAQHSSFTWMTPAQLVNSPHVHPYTKAYASHIPKDEQ